MQKVASDIRIINRRMEEKNRLYRRKLYKICIILSCFYIHLWDKCGSTLKEKLQKLQNRAARIITGAYYDVRSKDLLHVLSWENLNDRHRISKFDL